MLFIGLMFIFLIGVVGLAVDGAVAYAYSISVERAAAAAALAGVPYMPDNFNTPLGGPNATTKANAEASRNGYANTPPGCIKGVCDPWVEPKNIATAPRDLEVTITKKVPTFFMQALGLAPITVSRTAIAGYLPTIELGQPGDTLGSTVSQLGTGNNFYFPRFKGWDNLRSEGDPYTPNPVDGPNTSKDVHQISEQAGSEAAAVGSCTAASVAGALAGWSLPCRGGFNYQITVPPGQTAEIDIYNAANDPELGKGGANKCENSRQVPVGKCNATLSFNESDNGAACPCAGNNAKQTQFNAAAYTLFKINDPFLRATDTALVQTRVTPIDASNWDGDGGNTGPGSAKQPSYTDVRTDNKINQYYNPVVGGLKGDPPVNMLIYHAWADINRYLPPAGLGLLGIDTTNEGKLIQRKSTAAWNPNKPLGQGTYRLRIDALKFDGTLWATPDTGGGVGKASHGWAVRAIMSAADPNVAASVNPCAPQACRVSAMNDLTIYTPIKKGTGTIPLFRLPAEYKGATVDVDVFDVGDSAGTVNLSILTPWPGPGPWPVPGAVTYNSSTNVGIWNNGISRFNADQTCASGCVNHVPPQFPAPKPLGVVGIPGTNATYEAANPGYCNPAGQCGPEYNGGWIRIEMQIPLDYNPDPMVAGSEYWYLQYQNTGGANDTFSFAVQAKGGPVHLKS